MRLPNGYGTVTKLSGKRRKPYIAKKFVCWIVDDVTKKSIPQYQIIGYFEKRADALQALSEYNIDPTVLTHKKTFDEVYTEWSDKHFPSITEGSARGYVTAYHKFTTIYDRPFADLNSYDYEAIVTERMPRSSRNQCKLLLSAMYDYAIKHEICHKDYSKMVDFKIDMKSRIERVPFTPEEVDHLWNNRSLIADMVLFAIYTGMRANEICKVMVREVDLEAQVMRIAGSKTENGRNRTVPIHPDILPMVTEYCLKSGKNKALFARNTGKPYASPTFRVYFAELTGHNSHDARHTFATCAKLSGMDELARKLILGHAVDNVTDKVYTHLPDDYLVNEMKKFRIS